MAAVLFADLDPGDLARVFAWSSIALDVNPLT
jgi:hypothetical protein